MSWESSLHYYRLINEGVRARLGGLHSAQLLLYSVDFAPIERMQAEARWDDAGAALATAARALERGGADFLILCTNTMHRVAAQLEAAVQIPLIHVADTAARAVRQAGITRVGLLGTRFTMEQPFYRERLRDRHQLDVLTPPEPERATIHRIIYDELCRGRVEPASAAQLRQIAAGLVANGAGAIILGCTELMMALGPDDVAAPLFDTTALHAAAAVARALDHPELDDRHQ
jgi:aspartate racemase